MTRRERALRMLLVWWSVMWLSLVLAGGFARWDLWLYAAGFLATGFTACMMALLEYIYVRDALEEPWQAPVVTDTPREERQIVGYRPYWDADTGEAVCASPNCDCIKRCDDKSWVSPPARESR